MALPTSSSALVDQQVVQAGANPFDQDLNIADTPSFAGLTIAGTGQFDNLQFATVGAGADSPAPDGTYSPVTSITISNGVISAIS